MDIKEMNKYSSEVKEKWGNAIQYNEYKEKSKNRTKQDLENINDKLMGIFAKLGELKHLSAEDEKVQEKIKMLQEFISENYYTCTNEILYSLGQMYVSDERFKNNIDKVAGDGSAQFVFQAISSYCLK